MLYYTITIDSSSSNIPFLLVTKTELRCDQMKFKRQLISG